MLLKFAFLSSFTFFVFPVGTADEECNAFKNLTKRLNTVRMDLKCKQNDECNGFDCTGIYRVPVGKSRIEYDFCLGMKIQNCLTPIAADLYVNIPRKNISFAERVFHDQRIPIPGAHLKLGPSTFDAFLVVTLEEFNNENKIKIGIKMVIGVSYGAAWTTVFPPGLQQSIVPEQNITIDKCKHPVSNLPDPTPRTCNSKQIPTAPAWTTSPPTEKIKIKKCEISDLNGCDSHQQCEALDSGASYCVCLDHYDYNKSRKKCVYSRYPHSIPHFWTTVPANVTEEPLTHSGDSSGSTKAVVIACSVIGVLIVLVIVFVLAFVIVRKRRARYAEHTLLDNDDDEIM